MAIQDIKIRYTSDTSGLTSAEKSVLGLSRAEEELKNETKKANDEARKQGKAFDESAKQAKGSIGELSGALKGLGGLVAGAFAVSSIVDFGKKVIQITGETQRYQAVLTNTLGSLDKANVAMQLIASTAAKTNFSVQQLTDSYVKFANQGLVLTERQIMKLADVANSTGKSFDQLTEAILDAQTGQFERLKEFGILAAKHGDKVTFSFKGVKTQVDFTSKSIQDYLFGLGELNGVAGSTEAISATLEGRLSNLGDAVDSLAKRIGKRAEAGTNSLVASLFDAVTLMDKLFRTADERRSENSAKNLSNLEDEAKIIAAITEKTQRLNDLRAKTNLQGALGTSGSTFLKGEQEEINQLEADLQFLQVNLQMARDRAKENGEKQTTENVKQAKARYDARLKELDQQEQFAIREAKLIDATEADILRIRRYYNGLRLELQGNTANQIKDFTIKEKELVKEIKGQEMKEIKPILGTSLIEFKEIEKEKVKAVKDSTNERVKLEKDASNNIMAIGQALLSTFASIYGTISEVNRQELNNQLNDLGVQKEAELKLAGDNKNQQAIINEKYAQREKELKRRQAQADKEAAIFNAVINVAQGVTAALSQKPPVSFILAALVAAAGAVQIGAISQRPLPKYNKGTKSVSGIDRGFDEVHAILRPKEAVIPVDTARDYRPAIDAIYDRTIPANVMNDLALGKIDLEKRGDGALLNEMRGIKAELKNLKQVNVVIDKKGVQSYMNSKDSRVEYLNSYFTL
jgi:hypothetical protein